MPNIRPAAVAGSWYPARRPSWPRGRRLPVARERDAGERFDSLTAVIAPHAGLMYRPGRGARYGLLRGRIFDVDRAGRPVAFRRVRRRRGVSRRRIRDTVRRRGDRRDAARSRSCAPRRSSASTPRRTRASTPSKCSCRSCSVWRPDADRAAGDGLSVGGNGARAGRRARRGSRGRRALLVASTDLSHYHDAATAARLDRVVLDHVARFDADGLQRALDRTPDHACGGGPTVAVMRAARALGARDASVLKYADSGDVSGDKSAVVGYMAAAIGWSQRSEPASPRRRNGRIWQVA